MDHTSRITSGAIASSASNDRIEQYLPVNPTNRHGDLVWAKLRRSPKAPWTWEDARGITREFAYVSFVDDVGAASSQLVWRFPGEDIYRLWDRHALRNDAVAKAVSLP
jgi:hypothetical protein